MYALRTKRKREEAENEVPLSEQPATTRSLKRKKIEGAELEPEQYVNNSGDFVEVGRGSSAVCLLSTFGKGTTDVIIKLPVVKNYSSKLCKEAKQTLEFAKECKHLISSFGTTSGGFLVSEFIGFHPQFAVRDSELSSEYSSAVTSLFLKTGDGDGSLVRIKTSTILPSNLQTHLDLKYSEYFEMIMRERKMDGVVENWVQGLKFLHGKGLIHNDVIPENLFIKQGTLGEAGSNTIYPEGKIGDLGLCTNASKYAAQFPPRFVPYAKDIHEFCQVLDKIQNWRGGAYFNRESYEAMRERSVFPVERRSFRIIDQFYRVFVKLLRQRQKNVKGLL